MVVALRMGYNSADSDGKAWFDRVEVAEDHDMYIRRSRHIKLMIPTRTVPPECSEAHMGRWLGHLDEAWDSYKKLHSGREPWDGKPMKIRAGKISAWAFAGNPIQWNVDCVGEALEWVGRHDDWLFGMLHEMGHNFSAHIGMGSKNDSWNFDEEVSANFRMAWVLANTTGAQVWMGYKGSGKRRYDGNIIDYYKLWYDDSVGKNLSANRDAIQYTLLRIVEKWGWEPFVKAFDYLYALNVDTPVGYREWGKWKRFEFFLDTVGRYIPAGEDIRSTYTQDELRLIRKGLDEGVK